MPATLVEIGLKCRVRLGIPGIDVARAAFQPEQDARLRLAVRRLLASPPARRYCGSWMPKKAERPHPQKISPRTLRRVKFDIRNVHCLTPSNDSPRIRASTHGPHKSRRACFPMLRWPISAATLVSSAGSGAARAPPDKIRRMISAFDLARIRSSRCSRPLRRAQLHVIGRAGQHVQRLTQIGLLFRSGTVQRFGRPYIPGSAKRRYRARAS